MTRSILWFMVCCLAFWSGRQVGRSQRWKIYQHPPCPTCGQTVDREPVTHWFICENPKCQKFNCICCDPPLEGECPECRHYTIDGRCVDKRCSKYAATLEEEAAAKFLRQG